MYRCSPLLLGRKLIIQPHPNRATVAFSLVDGKREDDDRYDALKNKSPTTRCRGVTGYVARQETELSLGNAQYAILMEREAGRDLDAEHHVC
jgi:hypothetical protein